ncbi:MAG TPA: dihydroorotate dehydrogenase [Candidatus Polarisedimenticolia bacterium]|nr:dihydroorotate dehydrogenase [Candidatus Polarisedimenticolia bacterium]
MGLNTPPDLRIRLGPLVLKNPVVTASGTFGYGTEFLPYLDLARLGGICVKGLSLKPRKGNPPPRTAEIPAGMLNAIGLANVGVEAFVAKKLPALRRFDTAVIANVFGETVEEYAEVARILSAAEGVAALELNISCPNTEKGGRVFGCDPDGTSRVVSAVRRVSSLPLIVKLTPNVTDILTVARAAVESGADILSLVNTFLGIAVDLEGRRMVLANGVGGVSGPAIRPQALYLVHRVCSEVKVPVMGMGGIMSASDALEFLLVGARAVQVGTANFVDPAASVKILDGIAAYFQSRGIPSVAHFVGSLKESRQSTIFST